MPLTNQRPQMFDPIEQHEIDNRTSQVCYALFYRLSRRFCQF